MTDIERVRQLIEMMVEHQLTEVSIRQGEEEICLKRPGAPGLSGASASALSMVSMSGASPAAPPGLPWPAETAAQPEAEDLVFIRSPMVGTYYAAPSEGAEPFVTEGMEVRPDSVVCIIEAMKVFNEIRAEVAGIIRRIHVKNAQMVDYGKELFAIRAF